jgi:diguanylate cyclase (GGDEF)-like protein
MWAKLISLYSPDSYKTEEDGQAARILFVSILGSLVIFLFVLLGGFYWDDRGIIFIGVTGIVVQFLPLALLINKKVQASSFIVGLFSVILVTIATTLGQGIHDITIMAYPVIIIIASLIMHRNIFFFLSLLTMASISWLVYGEANGLFVTKRILTPSWADWLIMVSILLVAALAVFMQASKMRENLRLARQEIERRKSMEEQLRFLGTHDILTGIYNRLFFQEQLLRLERSREFPVSVIVADMDNLKYTNDLLGHSTGDELLKRTANLFNAIFRAEDVLARIGGDEFAVLLPNTDAVTAEQIRGRVRDRITENNVRYADLPVQLSLGVATAETKNIARAFTLADQRMYEEKAIHKSAEDKPPAAVTRAD